MVQSSALSRVIPCYCNQFQQSSAYSDRNRTSSFVIAVSNAGWNNMDMDMGRNYCSETKRYPKVQYIFPNIMSGRSCFSKAEAAEGTITTFAE